jgi:hypothetical protein
MKTSLIAGFLCAAGCTEPASKPLSAKSLSLDSVPSLPSVDPKTLIISDISVSQFANPDLDGALQPLVDFRYSGTAEYVEVMTCVEGTGQCSQSKNIFQTQSTLANSPNGSEVVVKLRGCIDPARSIGSGNCGEWFQKTYTQWAVTDTALAAMIQEAEDIESATKELKESLEKLFKLKSERAKKCTPATAEQKALLEADRAFVESIGKLGQGAVGLIANTLTIKNGSKCVKEEKAKAETAATGDTKIQPEKQPPEAAASLNFLSGLSQGGLPTLPNLSSANLKTVVDKLTEGVNKKAEAGNADAEAAKACLEKKAAAASGASGASAASGASKKAPAKAPGISVKDVADVIPDISTSIFDIANADRAVALEGICIKSLGEKFDASLKATEAAAKGMAERLQERRAALKARAKGAGQ